MEGRDVPDWPSAARSRSVSLGSEAANVSSRASRSLSVRTFQMGDQRRWQVVAGAIYRFRSSMLIRSPRAAAAASGSRIMENASVMLRRRGRGSAAMLCPCVEEGGGYAVCAMVKRETRPQSDAYHCDPNRAPGRRDGRHVFGRNNSERFMHL